MIAENKALVLCNRFEYKRIALCGWQLYECPYLKSCFSFMHVQSVDQNKAIKNVKRTITELDRSTIEEQKKAIRAGYDMEILPSDLKTYGRDAKALLKELQSQNERMFLVTILVLNTGRTEQELETNVFQASSIAQKHNCNLCRLDFQQEQGLMSSLPLADCQVEIQRGLTTSSTAIFVPFTTQELYQSGRESLYYGLNALSNNLIMVDRKRLKNPNGLILGTPGSGKSFSAKREITNAFLVTDDDIIVCDPEAEYAPLVERLHGQVIRISPASTQYINPLDINSNYSEEDNPLALKADFILSLCELVVGGKEGLLPVEKTVIDRCVHLIYRKYFADPAPENMPLLEDLYNALLQQDEKEAHHVAAALEIYVKGSLNVFNHRTNVDINNRIQATQRGGNRIGLLYRVTNGNYFSMANWMDQKLVNCAPNREETEYMGYIPATIGGKQNPVMRLLAVLEIFGLASYEVRGGQNLEIFVRVNDPQKIRSLSEDRRYKNLQLQEIHRRHTAAEEMMLSFLTKELTSKQRWDLIEDYFLGHDEVVEQALGMGEQN